jgi:excisionase family DNA binding protein
MTLIQFPTRKEIKFERGTVKQPDKPYLSTEEVADLLGFSDRTISALAVAWHESGGIDGLPAFKVGRAWRFERKDLEAYIANKKLPLQPIVRTAASA